MNEFEKVQAFGQSFWLDNIHRKMISSGHLEKLIASGEIHGVTSNPSIFNNAIANSSDYDDAIQAMAISGWSPEAIIDTLSIEDITGAADRFLPLYHETDHWDGYVSLEVNPLLAQDTEGTIKEAQRLWQRVDRPNLMIKIPATVAGLLAITQTIAAGINVNVTLIFSLDRYNQVMDAYLAGLEKRLTNNMPLENIFSVASFFVSRVDTKVDARLHELVNSGKISGGRVAHLFGTAAIANVRLAYQVYEEQFSSERFKFLFARGAMPQRPLWASTSTKNQDYPDLMYVTDLIGKDTINTLPPVTLDAFRDHGVAIATLPGKTGQARQIFEELDHVGIDLTDVFEQLELEGVNTFADAYRSLTTAIDKKSTAFKHALSSLLPSVTSRINNLTKEDILLRLQHQDSSLWSSGEADASEIVNRLGWLTLPMTQMSSINSLENIASQVHSDGLNNILLLGMGGSSLAPEVISDVFSKFQTSAPIINFSILDSTDPEQVAETEVRYPPETSLYIVSSKSGTTSEVSALFEYFWSLGQSALKHDPGKHFIAITDPDTPLEKLALERGFRTVVHGDPHVGGRYSALSAFGLLPAALMGINLSRFLQSAQYMASLHDPNIPAGRSPGVVLGVLLAEAALALKDKVTFIADPELLSFGSWLEQLIAESSGKKGKGIIPVDLEPVSSPDHYGSDRLFIYLSSTGEQANRIHDLMALNLPVLTIQVDNPYQLAAEFYRWEVAVAVATHLIGVNGFDQPDVQDSKTRTAVKVKDYLQNGSLLEGPPIWQSNAARVYGETSSTLDPELSLREVIEQFINSASEGNYIAINAYLPRDAETFVSLHAFRARLIAITNCATTLGFGPRFLHSTGQLHKGGPDTGLYIQITREVEDRKSPIPEIGVNFATLQAAQALGDYEALRDRGRRVLRVHLLTSNLSELLE